MGLKLQGIPSSPATRLGLEGKTVAIDAPNLLYAFYAVQLLHREPTRELREGALRAATRGILARIQDLENVGARSIVVFDGPPHPLKLAHLVERDATRSVPAIAPEEYGPVADAVRAKGTPLVQAPHDAEAQASAMARRGLADVVATTDWDALAMGAPTLLRNLSAHPSKTEGRCWTMVHATDALASLGATRERLAAAAVLMGCDYHPGFPGVGPKKAFKLLGEPTAHPEAALFRALDQLGIGDGHEARESAHAAYQLLVDPPWTREVPVRKQVKSPRLDTFA
jgi:flap endonuclease-1